MWLTIKDHTGNVIVNDRFHDAFLYEVIAMYSSADLAESWYGVKHYALTATADYIICLRSERQVYMALWRFYRRYGARVGYMIKVSSEQGSTVLRSAVYGVRLETPLSADETRRILESFEVNPWLQYRPLEKVLKARRS